MNSPRLVVAFLNLTLLAAAGEVSGHAVITKRLTKKPIAPAVYSLRGTAPTVASEGESENEFDRMVVMLEGSPAASAAPVTVVMDQHNARFEPELLVIPVGSSVQFPNSDPIFHNVFSLSKAESFDLGYYPRGKSRTVKFDHSGIVQVYCHLHASMYAAIVVTSSPWYGKPAADGSFSFSNVPAGHYRVMAWHKVAGLHQTEIDVPQSGMAEVTLHIPFDVEPRK
jgi:plastocyanin